MAELGVRLSGDDELLRKLDRLKTVTIRGIVRRVVMEGGRRVSRDAKTRVPVDQGILKQSIGIQGLRAKGRHRHVQAVKVGPRKGFIVPKSGSGSGFLDAPDWGWWVEMGTAFQKARPYLRPALRAMAPGIINGFRAGISRGIKTAVSKGRIR